MPKVQVAITTRTGADFTICDDDQIYVVEDSGSADPTFIHLGQAKVHRFADLIGYLHRLSIHATDA